MSEPFSEKTTMREKYDPAMSITEQAEADAYFKRCVEHTMCYAEDPRYATREGAEDVERQNLGYFAGYYDSETRRRVERLFRCAHPVFGSMEQFGKPTPDAAFQSGLERGMKAREEQS